MENVPGKVKDIRGGTTVEEVLANMQQMHHNLREVIVLAVVKDTGTIIMRRTRMSVSDLATASAVLQANVTNEILDLK